MEDANVKIEDGKDDSVDPDTMYQYVYSDWTLYIH